MAIVTMNDLLNQVNILIGENTSDESISLIENVTDTFNDLNEKANNNEAEKWKTKYEENDKEWRNKYKSRFMSGGTEKPDNELDITEPPEPPKKRTFESLFKEGE